MKNMKVRLPMYFIGLFVMTIGIALSVKSNLGVSPVSSIPYTMTCVWGYAARQCFLYCIWYLFIFAAELDSTRRRRLYAGSFFCHAY